MILVLLTGTQRNDALLHGTGIGRFNDCQPKKVNPQDGKDVPESRRMYPEPLNPTPMGANSVSPAPPRAYNAPPLRVHCMRCVPDEIEKNHHPNNIPARARAQARAPSTRSA